MKNSSASSMSVDSALALVGSEFPVSGKKTQGGHLSGDYLQEGKMVSFTIRPHDLPPHLQQLPYESEATVLAKVINVSTYGRVGDRIPVLVMQPC